MNSKYMDYQALELIPPSIAQTQQNFSFLTWIQHILRRLRIHSPQSSIPFVWKTIDAFGETRWNVFDRLTGQTLCFMSEQKFWDWLEQRYYR